MKLNLLARLGSALSAFAAEAGGPMASGPVVQKGAAWPFDRVPIIDGSGYIDKLHKPYADSVWVSRAIKQVAAPIQSVTLRFYANGKEITDAPWLRFWKRPVKGMTQGDFIEALVGWLKLSGESFIILPDEFSVPFPDRAIAWPPLILARPDRMRAIKDSQGELAQWQFTPTSGKAMALLPEQVIQLKYWNPYDAIRGMSEYEAARVASEGDYLSGKFALNLARANGDTGVIIGVEGGTMPDDGQMEQIRNQLRLKQEKSRRGEFASVFVPANLKIEDPKVRMPDAEFTAQRLENRHEIYVAFGLPPSMADVVQSYSVGSASDRYRAIEEASMPTARKIAEPISRIASMMAGTEIEARFDWPEHPVLQTVRNEKLDAGVKLVNLGMPWKIASDYLHLDLPRFPGDQQGYLPAALLPVGGEALTGLEEDGAFGEEGDDATDDALRAIKVLREGQIGRMRQMGRMREPACGCSLNDSQLNDSQLELRGRSEKEIKLWRGIVASRREFIRAFASKFNRVLMEARSEVLAKLAHAEKSSSPETAHVAADFTFDVAKFSDRLIASMRAVSLDALQKSGNQVMAELGKGESWQILSAQTLKFFNDRKSKLAAVADEISDRIRNRISGGLQHGDSLQEIAGAVRAEFNHISSGRAHHIASMETAAACGVGRHQAMKDAGVQHKQWLASGNANVRAAHSAMNNVKVPMDEPFKVKNPDGKTDEIMHPGDPDGEPWNVVNCHCVELAAAPDEGDEED